MFRTTFGFVLWQHNMSRIATTNTTSTSQIETAATAAAGINNCGAAAVPLIDIGDGSTIDTDFETSKELVRALQNSGFAIVRSPLLGTDLQSSALQASSDFLANPPKRESATNTDINSNGSPIVEVIQHPTDPKSYAMMDSYQEFDDVSPILGDYVRSLQSIKRLVLKHIAIGLGMENAEFFTSLHDQDNDTLRLIRYHPTHSTTTGNRCKEHSDYGSITLLSTDGNSGLELYHENVWKPVPHVPGALVVNVGSLLSGWTNDSLKATLHRVAGPASSNSGTPNELLVQAVCHARTSIAFFADPNQDVSKVLAKTNNIHSVEEDSFLQGMSSVAEYIAWRSGGSGATRSGVSFTEQESKRIHRNDEDK